MIGEVEPLKALPNPGDRDQGIKGVLSQYPGRILGTDELFYKLRRGPEPPSDPGEYDSPPDALVGKGRLDSRTLPVMYGSQDLEVCIHECRVTVDDIVYVATLRPSRQLRLLDLTAILPEETA